MAGLVSTDFALRGGAALTSFDVFKAGPKNEKNLKDQLEAGNPKEGLQAMKRIIKMMSGGEDVSYLFPSVVKHIVSQEMEVKKLVYVYLVRYAEEQPDIALLSINSFQKDLKDPSQLIRASALRVMSSIRVEVIVPLIMLAVKQTITDMSPYVRKVTAHAIPKIYSEDPSQKDELLKLIEQLLGDRATLVLGSAIHTFETVCPDRLDLIDKHFRKFCTVVVDLDEWGQIACINLLTRYARTQFTDPNFGEGDEEAEDRPFYSDSDADSSSDSESDTPDGSGDEAARPRSRGPMDADHRLLLTAVKPLLLSRNSGVVFAVAQLYYYLAPRTEVHIVGKAMTRLVRANREIAHTVLQTIEAMSAKRPNMFSSYLKAFFIRNDAMTVAVTKISILTNLASSINIGIILREFTAYIRSIKIEVVVAAIEAIGRCASKLPEITNQCISSLMPFLTSSNEEVAGMCIVSIKRLLQQNGDAETNKEMIASLAKMLLRGKISVPLARASVIWLTGEYAEAAPRIAPDVLRLGAKTFASAESIEKLQVLNLGVKLYLIGAKKAERILKHVLNLAKYDTNYDIRDRARLVRAIIFDERTAHLKERASEIFLASKPAPKFQDPTAGKNTHTLGSLSNVLGMDLPGYLPMPPFPEVAPDPKPRQVEVQQDFYATSMSSRMGGFEMFPRPLQSESSSRHKVGSDFYDTSSESESDSHSDSSSYTGSGSESDSDSRSSRSRSPARNRKRGDSRSSSRSSSGSSGSSRSRSRSSSPGSRSDTSATNVRGRDTSHREARKRK